MLGAHLGVYEASRALKQQLRRDRISHLRSIHADSEEVAEAHLSCASPPLFANLRCGVWYVPPLLRSGTCYFKSTDGHHSHWDFSLSRLNLQVALTAAKHGSVSIVDATRSGKRFPDALSKTVPIWCCVLNRAVAAGHNPPAQWDTALHLPQWVPPSEAAQIESKLPIWVGSLAHPALATVLSQLREALRLPLRPYWHCSGEDTSINVPPPKHPPLAISVILISASRVMTAAAARELHGWPYVQGAGDDDENWSGGLKASQWWAWSDTLMHIAARDPAAAERELQRRLEEASGANVSDKVSSGAGSGVPYALWDTGILLGDLASTRRIKENSESQDVALLQLGPQLNSEIWGKGVCDIWEKWVSGWRNQLGPQALEAAGTAVKEKAVEETAVEGQAVPAQRGQEAVSHRDARPPLGDCMSLQGKASVGVSSVESNLSNLYLHLALADGKLCGRSNRHLWQQTLLPSAIRFSHHHLSLGRQLLITCEHGTNRAPAVAAAVLLALYEVSLLPDFPRMPHPICRTPYF
tara:strand:+ start:1035 stop:2609 length:1575 start_codon:yes stop_codon:yes gene_type:complete